jgi:hypothetical protein
MKAFHVAQVSNRLYRRLPACRPFDFMKRSQISSVSRLEIGDTAGWKPALRNAGLVFAIAMLVLFVLAPRPALGQAADVPIYKQGRKEFEQDDKVAAAAKGLFTSGKAVKLAQAKEQIKRTSCQIIVPATNSTRLRPQQLCVLGRASHLRVGWGYYCDKCDDWHINLAGGYVINTNGAIATCYHVINPAHEIKDGCLVAADEDGKVFPVTEILAANRYSDAAILKVEAEGYKPLPLNTNVYPGDRIFCYSDPLDHRGYFSEGIINRFYQFPGRWSFGASASTANRPTRINVSTDWAPGSSGSAVLDEFGNTIGHVATIGVLTGQEFNEDEGTVVRGPTMIVFHDAVAARDVLLLIKAPN